MTSPLAALEMEPEFAGFVLVDLELGSHRSSPVFTRMATNLHARYLVEKSFEKSIVSMRSTTVLFLSRFPEARILRAPVFMYQHGPVEGSIDFSSCPQDYLREIVSAKL